MTDHKIVYKIADIYSGNPKVNSVIRTLLYKHGPEGLWKAVAAYVDSPEGRDWIAEDIWELYQAARWVKSF